MALGKKLKKNTEISLDEIFLDSKNIPGFDTERFEGRLEFPLDRKTLKIIGALFFVIKFNKVEVPTEESINKEENLEISPEGNLKNNEEVINCSLYEERLVLYKTP